MKPWVRLAARLGLTASLLAGLSIAGYLAWHHDNQVYGDASVHLANCPQTDTVNCDLVNTSRWSEIWGIPIAGYAIPTYLLVLWLIWIDTARSRTWAFAFTIGILTTLASAFLFYVSKVQLGFVCLWCMRLYAVNLSILLLTWLGTGRSPRTLLGETFADLRSWPRALRQATAFFAAALVILAVSQRGYRSWLQEKTAREVERVMSEGGPTVPAIPQSGQGSGDDRPSPATENGEPAPIPPKEGSSNDGAAVRARMEDVRAASFFPLSGMLLDPGAPSNPAVANAAPTPQAPAYHFAGPVRRLSNAKDGMKSEPFDLQARLGAGKPVALIFWFPGFLQSQRALVDWAAWLKATTPQIEVYALTGKRADQKDEELWEVFSMLDLPAELPLLVDDEFKLTNGLDAGDVPNLALFDRKGAMVIAKMKNRQQMLVGPAGNVQAEDVVRKVAAGQDVATVQRMFPYYPATALYGKCAPSFTAKKFNSSESFTFTGKSPNGRPTMLIFWSSTCKHCQVEIPNLRAWLKHNPDAIDIVSVTHIKADRPGEPSHRKITEAYIKSQAITWTVVEDPDRAIEDLYGSVSTPTVYFIGPDGTVWNAWFYAHETGFTEAMAKELAHPSAASSCQAFRPASLPKMDFQVMGPDGKRVALASLVDKPTLVHFWATWCKPCQEELPSLLRFRDTVEKSGDARVILVSVEDESAGPKIAAYQKTLGKDLRSYRAPKGGLSDRLDFSYRVPRTYVLGPGATLVGTRQGGQNWDDPAVVEKVTSRLLNSKGL